MATYRFYARANAAQDRIWKDTIELWGEAQAATYIRGLHAHLERLVNIPPLWRRLPGNLALPEDIRGDVFFSRYERHYVFFRILTNSDIGVISILHDRMNLPARLAEDLAMLSAKPGNEPE